VLRALAIFGAILGPGIITGSVDNDAGGITTYSVAGALYGYNLLWTLAPSFVVLIVVQEMNARMGIVTGKGLADLIREGFGVKTTFLFLWGFCSPTWAIPPPSLRASPAAWRFLESANTSRFRFRPR
jgi:Mn2+/Fe2+ NRAMP family transporter